MKTLVNLQVSTGEKDMKEFLIFLNDKKACETRLRELEDARTDLRAVLELEKEFRQFKDNQQAAALDRIAAEKTLQEAMGKAQGIVDSAKDEIAKTKATMTEERKSLDGKARDMKDAQKHIDSTKQSVKQQAQTIESMRDKAESMMQDARDMKQEAEEVRERYNDALERLANIAKVKV